jgi:hypothetical protein
MVNFLSVKQACKLAIVNIADVYNDSDSVCVNIMMAVVKMMSVSIFNQIYHHEIRQKDAALKYSNTKHLK